MTAIHIFIVDTNVLIAGLISSQAESPTVKIVDAMLGGRLIYLLSPELLQEYRAVLLRPKLTGLHGLNAQQVDCLLTEITANAIWRETPDVSNESVPDPGDSHLWDLLETEPTAVLVTGDRLLIENPPPNRSVASPASCVVLALS
jgi:putative PIN family toxin of toxin-antitoxin system